ncbi:MAG TPA: hypothetical protein ENK19_11190, partial [Acidobacteria bacterium]|nr:hypothetical protein [Acidobacteriota bacterium]
TTARAPSLPAHLRPARRERPVTSTWARIPARARSRARPRATVALGLARDLALAGVRAQVEVTGRSLRAGLKWAGKLGARAVVILGEEELQAGEATLRHMDLGEQERIPLGRLVDVLGA